jgi:hypothetical protein
MDSRLDLVHVGWLRRETLLARAALIWVGLLLVAHEVAFNRFLMARNGLLWPPWGEEVAVAQDGNSPPPPPPGWPSPIGYLVIGVLLQIASYLGDYSGRLFYSAPLPVDEAAWPSVTLYKFGAGAALDPSEPPPAEYKPGDGLRLGDVGVHAGTLAELPGSYHFAFWGSVLGRLFVIGQFMRSAILCHPIFYTEALIPVIVLTCVIEICRHVSTIYRFVRDLYQ